MMKNTISETQIFRLTLITGLAFIIGGIISYPLIYMTYGEASVLMVILGFMLKYLVQGIIGCFVIAFQLRQYYPFKKLWIIGVSSILLGISIPIIIINQFFYALLVLPGLLIGFVFGKFLREKSAVWIMTATCGMSMLIANIYIMSSSAVWQEIHIWLSAKIGNYKALDMLPFAIVDFLMGAGIAFGVCLVLRKREM